MIIDASSLENGSAYVADVCVMGGGVAGIVLANELSKSLNVIVLEAGGEHYTPEAQELYASARPNPNGLPDTRHSRLRFLGGSSNHWENNVSPFEPLDFEKRDWIDNSGWPISYADIEPYYAKAGDYCGVQGDGYQTEYWEKTLSHSRAMPKSKTLTTDIAKASVPPVRFFASHGDSLRQSAAVKIIKNANVVGVDYEKESGKVIKAYFSSKPGKTNSVSAKVFVMCFGGIENARMLLTFNESNDNKLGNQHDNVGRYFMDHPVVRAAHFFAHDTSLFDLYQSAQLEGRIAVGFFNFQEDFVRKNHLTNMRMPITPQTNYVLSDGISSHHILSDAFSEGELPDNFGTHIMNYIRDIDMVAEATLRKGFSKRFFDSADEIGGYELAVMIEQTPHRDNRIKLSDIKDIFGIKKLEIDWEIKNEDKERFWRGLEFFAQEIAANSLGRVKLLKERSPRVWGNQLGYGHHHMGTTRMSNDYKSGVVDGDQLVYGTRNLFVAGSSVFPTGGHVPPTLTIVATAIRLAKKINKEINHG